MTYTFPELRAYEPLDADQIRWLLRSGVKARAMTDPHVILTAKGIKAHDDCFEETNDGPTWLVFVERLDVIYWQPRSGEIATWNRRAFALGEAAIGNPATWSFGYSLNIWKDPLDWLIAGRDGIVILQWECVFDRLRDAPRIAVDQTLLPQFRRHMKPPRMPDILVMSRSGAAAA